MLEERVRVPLHSTVTLTPAFAGAGFSQGPVHKTRWPRSRTYPAHRHRSDRAPPAQISLYDLGPDFRQDDGLGGRVGKLIPTPSFALTIVSGFRDGRHELSPLCPGACGARPRLVGDSIRLRRGHLRGHRQKARPDRACRFRDGPARDPGKSPRAGCLGHHHQTFKSGHDLRRASRTPLIAPGFCPWRISC